MSLNRVCGEATPTEVFIPAITLYVNLINKFKEARISAISTRGLRLLTGDMKVVVGS